MIKTQIKEVVPVQTAKVFAAIYFLLTLPFALIAVLVILIAAPGVAKAAGLLVLFAPFFYAAMGFVFVAIGALIYNFIAAHVGGIEFVLSDSEASDTL